MNFEVYDTSMQVSRTEQNIELATEATEYGMIF